MQRIKPNKCSHIYQQQQRSPGMMQQLSPLSLVTQQAVNGNHSSHRMMGHTQLPTGGDYNERMLEYIKLLQNNKSERRKFLIYDLMLKCQIINLFFFYFTDGSQSPETMSREALEMSRLAIWTMSMANNSPPISVNNTASPPNHEPQR